MAEAKVNKSNDTLGTGRRKTSVARVRIRPGKGNITINDRPFEVYFVNDQDRRNVLAPLDKSGKRDSVDVTIRVHGGGSTGQSGAVMLGLARALVKGGLTWARVTKLLEPIREQSAESIRLVILAYLTTVAMGSKTDDQAGRTLEMIDAFSTPYYSSEGFAPLLLSIGRLVFAE